MDLPQGSQTQITSWAT